MCGPRGAGERDLDRAARLPAARRRHGRRPRADRPARAAARRRPAAAAAASATFGVALAAALALLAGAQLAFDHGVIVAVAAPLVALIAGDARHAAGQPPVREPRPAPAQPPQRAAGAARGRAHRRAARRAARGAPAPRAGGRVPRRRHRRARLAHRRARRAARARARHARARTPSCCATPAPLHDVGKIGIPDRILLKPGALDPDEWLVMQSHTLIGARILAGSDSRVVQLAEEIALTHHERWDGGGYPNRPARRADPARRPHRAPSCDVFDALLSRAPLQAGVEPRGHARRARAPARAPLRRARARRVLRHPARARRGRRRAAGHDGCVTPTRFASADKLTDDDLQAAGPPRYPRPSRLAVPLRLPGEKAAKAAQALGLRHGRRPARAPPARPPRGAHGRRRSSTARSRPSSSRSARSPRGSVRRRGMRPLVEAVVADGTGDDEGDVLQPAVAASASTGPGTRLMLHGKYEGRNRFRVQSHAPTGEAGRRGGDVAHYPATEGLSSTQIAALVRERRGAAQRRARAAARPAARARAPARPRRRARRRALRRPGGRPPAARLRGAAAAQLALLRRRARRREAARAAAAARRPASSTAPLARELAAVRADRRPARGDGGDRRRPRAASGRCSGC